MQFHRPVLTKQFIVAGHDHLHVLLGVPDGLGAPRVRVRKPNPDGLSVEIGVPLVAMGS